MTDLVRILKAEKMGQDEDIYQGTIQKTCQQHASSGDGYKRVRWNVPMLGRTLLSMLQVTGLLLSTYFP